MAMGEKGKLQQVGFRLPEKLVQKIDAEAERNYRDRTGEIIHALKSYYEMEDEKQQFYDAIEEFHTKIEVLENEVKHIKEDRSS